MSTDNTPNSAAGFLRVTQIITAALAAGLVMFALVTIFVLRPSSKPAAEPWSIRPTLTLVALGYAVLVASAAFIVPHLISTSGAKNIPYDSKAPVDPGFEGWGPQAQNYFALFQTQQIIRCALLEGTGLFALIAYMLDGTYIPLIVGLTMVALILAHWPTEARLLSWMTNLRESAAKSSFPEL